MFEQDKSKAVSWRTWAWRAAATAQGAAVAGILVAGALWAFSMDRSGLEAPEANPPGAQMTIHADARGYSWRSVYIVGSESEATVLRRALEEGNNIRADLGLDYLIDEVIVADGAADAQRIERALLEGNLILASFGVEDWVINLVV